MSMSHPCYNVIGDVSAFLTALIEKTENLGISLNDRCESVDEYKSICRSLSGIGELLVEGMIGNRPIATYSLTEPIVHENWSVKCIEVASPKPGRHHQHGLEHAEVVIGSEADSPLNSQHILQEFMDSHSDLSFDTRAFDKELNADVSLDLFGNNSMSVKFHVRPLYEVISAEIELGKVIPVPLDYYK